MILSKIIRCYHLPDVVIEERVYKKIFSVGKTWFFTVNIAMFIYYFIFIWIFRIVCFFSAGILTICFWQILHAILKVKNDKWPVKEDYLGFRGSNRGSCYISTPTLHAPLPNLPITHLYPLPSFTSLCPPSFPNNPL